MNERFPWPPPEYVKDRTLDIEYLAACLKCSTWSKSGLEWRRRPRSHFKNDAACNRWNGRHPRRKAGVRHKGGWQIRLDGKTFRSNRLLKLLMERELRQRSFCGRNP